MHKSLLLIAASTVALITLTGCASQSATSTESQQLASIQLTLTQIQANQVELIALQKAQIGVQIESKNLQSLEYQKQLQLEDFSLRAGTDLSKRPSGHTR